MNPLRRAGLVVLAPLFAIVLSAVISAVALQASGHSAWKAYSDMYHFGTRLDSAISMLNRAVPLYISGLAVAIGFKMALFNIGVEGQYRLAALIAAWLGAQVHLWAPLHVVFILVVAMAVGAGWAAIPAVLKVTRGVHEVISTLMLNFVVTGISAYLLINYLRADRVDLNLKTKLIPASGLFPSLNRVLTGVGITVPGGSDLQGFLIVAVVIGVGFWLLLFRTRFGYDLRATGTSPTAARASGVDPKAMVMKTMLISGALAGLVGMSQVLGFFDRFTTDFPTGFGFTGLAVALLGRNHPAGIAVGALLFAFLDRSAQVLDLGGVPKEIVVIMQGVILLSAVVAYEVVHRMIQAQETQAAAHATRGAATSGRAEPAVS